MPITLILPNCTAADTLAFLQLLSGKQKLFIRATADPNAVVFSKVCTDMTTALASVVNTADVQTYLNDNISFPLPVPPVSNAGSGTTGNTTTGTGGTTT